MSIWTTLEAHARIDDRTLTVAAPVEGVHPQWHWSVWRVPAKSPDAELVYGSAETEAEAKAAAEAWVAKEAAVRAMKATARKATARKR